MKPHLIALMAAATICFTACHKSAPPTAAQTPDGTQTETPSVSADQSKFYMTAAEDLDGKVKEGTAGLKVLLLDSKYYAVGERVLSVSFTADKDIVTDGKTLTMTWASKDPLVYPVVGHAPEAAEFGLLCLPGSFQGVFTVKTSRYTYQFTQSVSVSSGAIASVTLDFAAPDQQPRRKGGVMGDSISTFDGALCNPERPERRRQCLHRGRQQGEDLLVAPHP